MPEEKKEIWERQKATIKQQWIIIGVLVVFVVMLINSIIYVESHRIVNVQVPPFNRPYVMGDKTDIENWGRFFIGLYADFSRSNFEDRVRILLGFTHGKAEKEIHDAAFDLKKTIEEKNIHQEFFPNEPSWRVNRVASNIYRVEVDGNLIRYFGKDETSNTGCKYWADIKYSGGVSLEGIGYAEK